jgi:hypothetical protein
MHCTKKCIFSVFISPLEDTINLQSTTPENPILLILKNIFSVYLLYSLLQYLVGKELASESEQLVGRQ